MSDETARQLAAAEAKAAEQQAKVAGLQRQLIESIADGIPAGVEKYARKVSHQQPEVTRAIGRDGIELMRGELAVKAAELAAELRAAGPSLEFPVDQYKIHDGVFQFLYGARLTKISSVLKQFGFEFDQHAIMSPYELFTREMFTADLLYAMQTLQQLRNAVTSARAVHDRSDVDSLWDDSE